MQAAEDFEGVKESSGSLLFVDLVHVFDGFGDQGGDQAALGCDEGDHGHGVFGAVLHRQGVLGGIPDDVVVQEGVHQFLFVVGVIFRVG